ncbi:MAG: 1-deoxy-D-xylulose-5-phosphate reductoisomerase [Candidatus Omnitrophica bacterium]|nr:1-deoxy-D-xylulose-5-phosphate reductoisomerase [Candidatus Omnitrophota bacterium]
MKKVAVFGSTGSIGRATLDIISRCREKFSVFGLVANKQKDLLNEQIHTFEPGFAVFVDEQGKDGVKKGKTTYLYGKQHLEFLATHPEVDIVVMAISGLGGLNCTIKALEAGKTVALASKEIIVCAGHLLKDKKGKILPVDSEHNAIFQILDREKNSVTEIMLTASGGPFLNYKGDLSDVTVNQVLNHPVWKMGKRITVDSATMMNKGFEVIEAFYLFGIEKENIRVLLHPQAIVHGFVRFCDGFVKAVCSIPDMRYSINYCLNYPERIDAGLPELDISSVKNLTFEELKQGLFPCFDLAREALKKDISYLTVLNAADEEAVGMFLDGRIKFDSIPVIIEKALERHHPVYLGNVSDILTLDQQVRDEIRTFVNV